MPYVTYRYLLEQVDLLITFQETILHNGLFHQHDILLGCYIIDTNRKPSMGTQKPRT